MNLFSLFSMTIKNIVGYTFSTIGISPFSNNFKDLFDKPKFSIQINVPTCNFCLMLFNLRTPYTDNNSDKTCFTNQIVMQVWKLEFFVTWS
jgi:hypothetical protein